MATNIFTSGKGKRAGARDAVWITLRIVVPGLLLAGAGDLVHVDVAAGIASVASSTSSLIASFL